MKKIMFLGIMIFIVSIGIGFCFGRVIIYNRNQEYFQSEANEVKEIINNNQVIAETISVELKVNPNIEFAIKEYYDECGHFNFEYMELPKELVNLTREEIEEHYNGNYEIEEFNEKSLILSREINGMCDNHYVIKLNENNLVTIYKMNTDTSYSLYETTEISKDFLPDSDVEKLEEGIVVYGIGKVNAMLEDFE
ncbi:MAG: hypothetical protein IKM97_01420 [Clostridia bacterium]|nr:hypothetical protein [Clostridia bacterium]